MTDQLCPRCQAPITSGPLYQCCRCFTIYCSNCQNTQEGRACPKCGMGSRLILAQGK